LEFKIAFIWNILWQDLRPDKHRKGYWNLILDNYYFNLTGTGNEEFSNFGLKLKTLWLGF